MPSNLRNNTVKRIEELKCTEWQETLWETSKRRFVDYTALVAWSTLAATLVLGCAVLRANMLARPFAWTLIVIGIITAPILLVTPVPIGPDWATDTIAFFLSGLGYTVVGMKMLAMDRKAPQQQVSLSAMTK